MNSKSSSFQMVRGTPPRPQTSGSSRKKGFLLFALALSALATHAQPLGQPRLLSYPSRVEHGGTYSITVGAQDAYGMPWLLYLNDQLIASGGLDTDFRDTTAIKIPDTAASGKASLILKTYGSYPNEVAPQVAKAEILVRDDPTTRLPTDLQVQGSLGDKTIKSTGTLPVGVLNYPLQQGTTYTVILFSGSAEIGRGTVNKTTRQAQVQYSLYDSVFNAESDYAHSLDVTLMAGTEEVFTRTTSVNVTPRKQLPIKITYSSLEIMVNAGDTIRYVVEPTEPVLGTPGRVLQGSFIKWLGRVVKTDKVALHETPSGSAFVIPPETATGLYHFTLYWEGDSTYAPFMSWPAMYGVLSK